MSGLGIRFAALVCLFVFLGEQSSANVLNRIPSKVDTAKGLTKNLPFLPDRFFKVHQSTPLFANLPGQGSRCPQCKSWSNLKMNDVVFIIDDSGSISLDQFNEGLEAVRIFIKISMEGSNFAAIKYSDTAIVLFKFVSQDQAKKSLANVQQDNGMTNTQAALKMARKDLFLNPASSGHRKGAGRVAVLVTDGNSNVASDQTVNQANLLKAIGTEVFVVAVGNYGTSGLQEMKSIASYPIDKHFYRVSDLRALRQVAQQVQANVQG